MNIPVLIVALAMVETNVDEKAVGDGGRAHGILQIHEIMVRDVNQIYGTRYTHEQMFSRQYAYQVAVLWLAHYQAQFIRATGRPAEYQDLARMWNGGPDGWSEAATCGYGAKVLTALDNLVGKSKVLADILRAKAEVEEILARKGYTV